MDSPEYPPKGVWYEKARNRWRVKVIQDSVTIHQSYHHDFYEALAIHQAVRKSLRHRVVPKASIINRFLCQPVVRL